MVQAQNRWRPVRGTIVGLLVGLTVLSGCRPTGRRALVEGDRFLQSGKPGEAVPLLERAASDLQTDGAAWNHLGRAYHETGRVADARKAYLRALQADRNLFEAHYNLGQLSLETGAWRDAEAGFRTWLGVGQNAAAGANAAVAWRGLGLAQFRQGNVNDAERSFGSALRLHAQDAESWNAVGLIRLQRRQYRDAFTTFTHAARLDSRFAPARLNAAVVAHQYLNDRRVALEYYRAYLALNPPDAAAITQLIAQLQGHNGAVAAPANLTPTTGPKELAAQPQPARATSTIAPTPAPAPPASPVATAAPPPSVPTPVIRPDVAARPTSPTTTPVTPLVTARPSEGLPSAVDRTGPTATSPPKRPLTSATPTSSPIVAVESPAPPLVPVAIRPPASDPAPPPASASVPTSPPIVPSPAVSPTAETPAVVVVAPEPDPASVTPVEEPVAEEPAGDPVAELVGTAPAGNPLPPEASAAPTIPPPAEPELSRAGGVALESTPPSVEPEVESNRRGFWTKANPVNWFKRDRPVAAIQTGKAITPLDFPPEPTSLPPAPASLKTAAAPAPVRTGVPLSATTNATASESIPRGVATPPPVRAPRPKPTLPRYQRQITAAPSAGDRAAAQIEFQRGLTAHQRGDLPAAMAGYQRAIRLDPAHFEAHHNLGLAAVDQGNLPLALRAAETAAALRPADPVARYQFAVVLQKDRYSDDAVAELEEVARMETNNAASHLAAAMIYANDLDQPGPARRHYEKVLALDPAHPQAPAIRRWLVNHPER